MSGYSTVVILSFFAAYVLRWPRVFYISRTTSTENIWYALT